VLYAVVAAFLFNTLILIAASHYRYPAYRQFLDNYQVGEVAERELVAEQSIRYVDTEATEERREEKAAEVSPVYTVQELEVMRGIRDLEGMAEMLGSVSPPEPEKVEEKLENTYGVSLTEEQVQYLLRLEGREAVLPVAEQLLQELMARGILPRSPRSGNNQQTELQRWEEGKKIRETLTPEKLLTLDTVPSRAKSALQGVEFSSNARKIVFSIVNGLARQTAFYNDAITEAQRKEARQSIRPITGRIHEGDTVIEKGEVVTSEDMRMIQIIRRNTPELESGEIIAAILFVVGIFFLGYALGAPLLHKTHRTLQNTILLLVVSAVFSFNILVVVLFSLVPPEFPFALGVLTVYYTMVVTIFVKRRIGVIMSLLLSLLFLILYDIGMYSFLLSFFSGIFAAYIIENAERRIDLVTGTVKIGASIAALLVVIALMQEQNITWFVASAGVGLVNAGVSGGLLIATLPVFEHLLNAPTVFRLRELSDTNTPIFRRMITIAPGTYSHSVGVAHLAESACREIGVNELIARVGSYYHDIGKMDQPEYFIENQTDYNRHDEISPNLSVAVIKSHVKIGKEKAKELKLPPEIVEIVADHHGSDVINYFYHQAKEQAKGPVGPEKYSYNGVPPRSKEAAVVMLADVIEAQSRTVKKPTIQRFEKMVWDAIMNKFNNKQLSNCELSMKELELIKRSFVQILAGQFHSRIEYPNTRELG